jgi:putative ubiquitin-RnfH superfamily antitoxin RatB of RatAB toxin-antitoxin module
MVDEIKVEIAYALPQEQVVLSLVVVPGTTIQQAIEQSGILKKFPDIDLTRSKLGIFAKLSKPETVLRDRDRVEIYRPLVADPKEVRKKRAEEGKVMKKGAGELERAADGDA